MNLAQLLIEDYAVELFNGLNSTNMSFEDFLYNFVVVVMRSKYYSVFQEEKVVYRAIINEGYPKLIKTMDDSRVKGKSFPISKLNVTSNWKGNNTYPIVKNYENMSTELFAINAVKNYHSHKNDSNFSKRFEPTNEDEMLAVYNIKI